VNIAIFSINARTERATAGGGIISLLVATAPLRALRRLGMKKWNYQNKSHTPRTDLSLVRERGALYLSLEHTLARFSPV
jgi:hypothetical protein